MSGAPIAISLTPAKQNWSGHPVHVHITDIGRQSLHVTAFPVLLHAHCAQSAAKGVVEVPPAFTIHPGQTVTASISVPAAQGDYGVLFQGTAVGAHGDVVAGAVGSQVLSGGAVSCVPVTHHVATVAPTTSGGGFPFLFVLAGVLALALALAAVVLVRRRRA